MYEKNLDWLFEEITENPPQPIKDPSSLLLSWSALEKKDPLFNYGVKRYRKPKRTRKDPKIVWLKKSRIWAVDIGRYAAEKKKFEKEYLLLDKCPMHEFQGDKYPDIDYLKLTGLSKQEF